MQDPGHLLHQNCQVPEQASLQIMSHSGYLHSTLY